MELKYLLVWRGFCISFFVSVHPATICQIPYYPLSLNLSSESTMRPFTESTKTSYWAHHSGSCGFKTQIVSSHLNTVHAPKEIDDFKDTRKCYRLRAFISCCLLKFSWFINSSEYENQIIDRPFYQTLDSSAVSMKSALGRDRIFVSEIFENLV